ncbi:MAG: hypothetical protein OEW92_12365 [Gammaproteobacteria bacterium]|nr:hypothetical protein [Gammaproteobacteria bacterium]MDH5173207.1 hypothetical protein [Gammaproteobacteria bacterium]
MNLLKKLASAAAVTLLLVLAGLDAWGYLTLGHLEPGSDQPHDRNANTVTMVFGATGSVGDGLLKAAMEDPEVEKIYVVSRRSSPRIEAGVASGKVELVLQPDFTNYGNLAPILGEVNTVLWGLGTSSLQVDDATYTRIHVDFPVAFLTAWLAARTQAPMSFHYVTGMGTDANGSAHWAREKGRAEIALAAMARGSGLRTFGYRSGFIRPASDRANPAHYLLEYLLRPGQLAISSEDLGRAMLEISARTGELANGTVVDNADSIAYARAYRETAG